MLASLTRILASLTQMMLVGQTWKTRVLLVLVGQTWKTRVLLVSLKAISAVPPTSQAGLGRLVAAAALLSLPVLVPVSVSVVVAVAAVVVAVVVVTAAAVEVTEEPVGHRYWCRLAT
jgi:hypothetical protein